ncbi:MAG: YfiR family protein [Bacteroidota bacterium]
MRRLVIVLSAIFLAGSAANAQQEKPMHEIHAAMLFNFVKYIQWPNEGDGGDFVLGVMGDEEVFNTLKTWYDGKPKGTKKYVVKKLASAEEAAGCAVVYLGKSKNREFEGIKTAITGKPVLTITDSANLGQKGSHINFKVQDGKLKFELNQASVTSSNLKVSSQLASMAILI